MSEKRTQYIITDGRPLEDAAIMDICETAEEAREYRPDYGESAQIWKHHDDGSGTMRPYVEWEQVTP